MKIILEGIDNTGKSYLAEKMGAYFKVPIQPSEGPPHYPGEMNKRLRRYADYAGSMIFDRHPIISQPIYGQLRATHLDTFSNEWYEWWAEHRQQFVIVYCDPPSASRQMDEHTMHEGVDTPEHVAAVKENYPQLLEAYRAWALREANIVYRIGDSIRRVIGAVEAMAAPFHPVKDITDFHQKYGIDYNGRPRDLPQDIADFRIKFMREELDEYETATCLADKLDALVDLEYVLLGTSHLHGFNHPEAWRRVHSANMKKMRVEREEDSKRGSKYDVVKPPGWTAPDLTDLVATTS